MMRGAAAGAVQRRIFELRAAIRTDRVHLR
jgi:hypothetical protein